MALHQLLQALERDTDVRVRQLRDQADAAAVRIRTEGEAALERRRASDLALEEARHRQACTAAIASARRAASEAVLSARAEALGRVRARAEALLEQVVPERAEGGGLARELAGALSYLGEGPVAIHCLPAWQGALAPGLADRPGVQFVHDVSVGPGAVLRSGDGRLSVDATLRARLARHWPELSIALVKELEARP